MPSPTPGAAIKPLRPLQPDLYERAWCSVPHPTLPLLATAHGKTVTVFSLASLTPHSTITNGHERSVRCAAWKPGLPPGRLCLVTGSFDSTAGLWRLENNQPDHGDDDDAPIDVARRQKKQDTSSEGEEDSEDEGDWQFTIVLEGHDSEIKSAAFSPSGAHLATCSRDKSVWIWEDVGADEDDDEWETVAVLNEHEGDVKAVAWCPDVANRTGRGKYSADLLASASYDDTVRLWREDGDGEWVCVAVLSGHAATVWGITWEAREREDGKFPRLLSYSTDGMIRVWRLKEEPDGESEEGGGAARTGLGGIPNTMRRSLREDWVCEAVLPKVHTRDIYSVSWSAKTGLVASTGSDGVIAVYQEDDSAPGEAATSEGSADESQANGSPGPKGWKVIATLGGGHGPYEVNHITWCQRYDRTPERKEDEEMLVTTGDDGQVRTWEISTEADP